MDTDPLTAPTDLPAEIDEEVLETLSGGSDRANVLNIS